MKKISSFLAIGTVLFGFISCQTGEIYEEFEKPTDVVNPNPPLPDVDFTKAGLAELAAKQGIKIGAAFTHSEYFQNDSIAGILKREFSSVTFGNEMKHDAIVAANGKLKFDTADEMVGWAKEADTELYGHVLGWHQQQNVTYLQGLVDKAAASNESSLFQNNWNFEAGNLDGYSASGIELTNAYIEVFAGSYSAKTTADDATLSFKADIAEGTAYMVSFWAKALGEGASITLTTGDKQKAKTAVEQSWTKYSVAFKTKSVADFSYQITASKDVIIDNIRVVETTIDEEETSTGGNYINPKAIGGGIDFESYEAGTTGSQLVSNYGWAQCNGADYVGVSSDKANSGSQSLKMENSDGHCANAWDIQVITPSFDVEAGKTYRIAWYGMANEEADIQIDIREDGSTKAYKNSAWGQYDKMGTNWTYQYLDYTVEAGSSLSVAFYGGTAAVCYYVDDFQVFEAIYDGDYTNYIDKTNLLVGGDFETDGAYGIWNGSDYASVVSRNEPEIGSNKDAVHSALHALVVDNSATGYSGGDAWHVQVAFNNKMDVVAGQSYRFGMWVKSPDGADTIQAELKWDTETNYKQLSGITDKWQFLYLDATAPDGASECQIVLDCAYSAGTYHIDDVQFYPTPIESCIEKSSVADDGDFESYADAAAMVSAGWQVNGSDYVTIVSDAHHGKQAVRMDNADGHASNAWDIQLVSKKYAVEPGTTYRIAWQGKADAADVDLQIDIRGGASTEYKSSAYGNYDKLGTDWVQQSYDYTTGDSQTEIQVGFYGGGSANVFTIDCFQIYPVGTSAQAAKAARGYGKYFSWKRPAPRKAASAEFESTNKLDGELAADALDYAYKNFVYGMVEHFDVYGWDVMNEVFTDGGNFRSGENTIDDDIFIWGDYFGGSKNFTDKAFAYATDALKLYGKKADLYINDYNLETAPSKRAALCEYAKGNPQVTGVGTQMHLDMATEGLEDKIVASLTELAATGKMVRISELDIKCTDTEAQAELYKFIFEKYIELVPAAQRGGITIWGINDKDSWVGEDNQPLLWSGNKYTKKPAYEALYVYLCELAGIYPYQEEE